MRGSSVGIVAGLLALAGCAQNDPLRPGDVACLDQFTQSLASSLPLDQALIVCKAHAVPDLTGDERLQEQAIAMQLPFQVQPLLDARLKFVRRWELSAKGSNIRPAVTIYTPKITVTEHD